MEVWSISNISDGGGWEIRNALCQFLWNMPQHAVIIVFFLILIRSLVANANGNCDIT